MVKKGNQTVISKKERHIASATIAILIIVISNWSSISNLFTKEPEPFINSGCEYSGYSDITPQLIDLLKNNWIGVPDYKVNLYLQPQNDRVLLNTEAEFTLESVDNGIIRLNDSYFYILVFDPDGELRTSFPCFCDGHKNKLGIRAYCWNNNRNDCTFSSSDTNPKFNKWENTNTWLENGQSKVCVDKKRVCVFPNTDICVLSQNLVQGKIDNRKVVYSFNADKI